MTAEEQIKAVAILLAPDSPDQKDIVFLVERYQKKMSEALKSKDKQIALLEEEKVELHKNIRDLANRNLQTEAKAQEEIKKVREEQQVERVNQKPQIKGKTL